jgi:pimeloyl-ACP methyl ester carboxylesterase
VDRYDLPAMLSHVMAVTGAERFHYIGHSMGTLSYYTACNYHPWIGRQFSSSFPPILLSSVLVYASLVVQIHGLTALVKVYKSIINSVESLANCTA